MTAAAPSVTYLESWRNATDPSDPPPVFYAEDGCVHFTHLKKLADSGEQFLTAISEPHRSSDAQELGSCVHALTLGQRKDRPVVCYTGKIRSGKAWEAFEAENAGATIVNATTWAKAERIAASVLRNPTAIEYMAGARFEVPLRWDDGGVPCSTSGVDIVGGGRIGDLKTANTTHIEKFQRQAFGYSYHAQMAFYARGAKANGIDTSRGLFILAVETVPPYEVVVHDIDADLLDLADKTISIWLEKFRVYRESNQWPPRAQSSVLWTVPTWMQGDEEDDA
jgi:hypothetical protein